VKKFAAILLLGILMFNWIGYRFITSYLEDRSNTQLNARLDQNIYDESDLVSVKIPNNLPYTNNKDFQRISGQIQIAGIAYNYVKMRVCSDFVEFLCIPNHDLTHMQTSKDEFFKLVNDLQQGNQQKKSENHPGTSKNFSLDFYTTINHLIQVNAPAMLADQGSFHNYASLIPSCYTPTAEQPPDIA
jgi:hypothetical protein